jgi:hypothetical protein
VGAYDPAGDTYVVHSSASPYYVAISAVSLRRLIEDTREAFLELPPTPTPTSSG